TLCSAFSPAAIGGCERCGTVIGHCFSPASTEVSAPSITPPHTHAHTHTRTHAHTHTRTHAHTHTHTHTHTYTQYCTYSKPEVPTVSGSKANKAGCTQRAWTQQEHVQGKN